MKPILFSTPMVQAILEDRKTQTRRKLSSISNPDEWKYDSVMFNEKHGTQAFFISEDSRFSGLYGYKCPYGNIGDVLWVRETWRFIQTNGEDYDGYFVYRASPNGKELEKYIKGWKWKPSIHMPKEACRLFLEITDIRVERLQEISEEDAKGEGVSADGPVGNMRVAMEMGPHRYQYVDQWKWETWQANPWVWVVSFKRIDKPAA